MQITLLIPSCIPCMAEIYESKSECMPSLATQGSDIETIRMICSAITTEKDKELLQERLEGEWKKRSAPQDTEYRRNSTEKTSVQIADPAYLERKRREDEERLRRECKEIHRRANESVSKEKKDRDPQLARVLYMKRYAECRNLYQTHAQKEGHRCAPRTNT
jgi:hypothetical protein